MPENVKSAHPIPEGYTAITPWIIARGVPKLIDYLKTAFDAMEIARIVNPDGLVGHAEVRIGGAAIMMFDAKPDWPDTPAFIRLYVEDGEAIFQQAIKAGGTKVTPMTDLGFGERVGRVRDPLGNLWWIQTHIEDLDTTEMEKRAGEKQYIEAMQSVQESFDHEMSNRKRKS